jgi:hypothetical protein
MIFNFLKLFLLLEICCQQKSDDNQTHACFLTLSLFLFFAFEPACEVT